jgi:Zn-dependent membrane protease YugP
MMMPFWDPTMILIIPALILALYAQHKVRSTYEKFSQVRSATGRTGAEMAKYLLSVNGLSHVEVVPVHGVLSDHYDPGKKKVCLSEHNYSEPSVAAVAVAAHECGHALQHARGYVPLNLRSAFVPAAQIGSTAAMPLFFIGMIANMPFLLTLGILFFAGAVVFQVVTLPVEFDASARALRELEERGLLASGQEVGMAKKVLDAAALTYVAAAAMALLQLVRLVLIRNSRD